MEAAQPKESMTRSQIHITSGVIQSEQRKECMLAQCHFLLYASVGNRRSKNALNLLQKLGIT